jgi:hypothetical protein
VLTMWWRWEDTRVRSCVGLYGFLSLRRLKEYRRVSGAKLCYSTALRGDVRVGDGRERGQVHL